MHVISVSETVYTAQSIVPNLTSTSDNAAEKFSPVMVTVVPPLVEPLFGVMAVILAPT